MPLMYQVMVKRMLHFIYNAANKPKSRPCITALPVSHSAAGVQPSLQLPSSGFTAPAQTSSAHTLLLITTHLTAYHCAYYWGV